MTTMNSFEDKSFLARIRGGEFAHPGEEAAVDLVLSHVTPKPNATVLDVGCGLGATADAIGKKTSAVVIGVDIDAESIRHANATYTCAQFVPGDMTKLGDLSLPEIDVIYAFNSLYACADLEACFAAFAQVAKKDAKQDARIGVFDYIAYDAGALAAADCLPGSVHEMAEMRQVPAQLGWACTDIVNLDLDYAAWYRNLLARMNTLESELSATRSKEFFDEVYTKYAAMLACLERGTLGGALHVYAR